MKVFFSILLLLLFSSVNSEAQNWALPSSKWIETEFNPWSGTYWPIHLSVQKDTVVQSIGCTKIVSDSLVYPDIVYTYSSGDTVYMFLNGTFSPVFYFNAQAGDTILVYNDTTISYNSLLFLHGIVDSVNLISLSGQNLKKFNVSIIDSLPYYIYPRHFAYAEKIGFFFTYPSLFYQLFSSIMDADSYDFCDYGDSTISGFWLYPDSNCRTNIGITEVSSDQVLSIYPNPVSDYLHITVGLDQYCLKLYDMTGREERFFIINNEIDIRRFSAGMYIICVTDSGKQTYIRKFIKE